MTAPLRARAARETTGTTAESRIRSHLKTLGLGEYETRVYIGLLTHGNLTGAELVRIAGVPQKRIYQVLARLSDLRLVDKEEHRGGRYLALGPGALQALVDARKSEVLAEVDHLDRATNEVLPLIAALHRPADAGAEIGDVDLLVGADQYRLAYNEIVRATTTELLSFTKPPFILPPDPRLNGVDVLRRGGTVRCIYELGPDGPVDETHRQVVVSGLTRWQEAGEEARVIDSLPAKIGVSDRHTVLLILTDRTTNALSPNAVVVRNRDFARAQVELFDLYWKRAAPITARKRAQLLKTLTSAEQSPVASA